MKRLVLTAIAALAFFAAPAASTGGNLLCHLPFDDESKPFKAEVGKDAFVRLGKNERVEGLNKTKWTNEGGDGGVTVPCDTSIAIPVPEALAKESGRPYSVLLKLKLHGMATHPVFNMPADKMDDTLISSTLYGRLSLRQHERDVMSRGGYGVVPQGKIFTLLLCFGADTTTAFIDEKQILSSAGLVEGKLAGSRADCSKAGGYFLLRGRAGDPWPADITFYDVKIYDGVVDPRDAFSVEKKTPAENAGGAENKNSPSSTTSPSPVETPTVNNPASPAGGKNGQTGGATSTNGGEGGASGNWLCRITFDDSVNPLKAEGVADAFVRKGRKGTTERVSGMGDIKWTSAGGDGAVEIPKDWHIALPVPDKLAKEPGHPYSIEMRFRLSALDDWQPLLNMPADNETDSLVYVNQGDSRLAIKQHNKANGTAVYGENGFVVGKDHTLVVNFGANKTTAFLDGKQVFTRECTLAGSYADCSKAGGYFLIRGDENGEGGTVTFYEVKVYDGAVGATTPAENAEGAENKNPPSNTTSPSPVETPTVNNPTSPVATPTANNPASPAGGKNGQTGGATSTNDGGTSTQGGGASTQGGGTSSSGGGTTVRYGTQPNQVMLANGAVLKGEYKDTTFIIPAGATVTFDGLILTNSGGTGSAIECLGDATIVMPPSASNNRILNNADEGSGIHWPAGCTLTIKGGIYERRMEVTSTKAHCAGIGAYSKDRGDGKGRCGNVVFEGGWTTANGGERAAGVGAADWGASCGNITIRGTAWVTANGGFGAAAIGAGARGGDCGDILIDGDMVIVEARRNVKKEKGGNADNGAGIGSGHDTKCGNITIRGAGRVEAYGHDARYGGAGIGAGGYDDDTGVASSCGDIIIENAHVIATGRGAAAGIGAGSHSRCGNIVIKGRKTGGKAVNAWGAPGAAGIGVRGADKTITITGDSVYAKAGAALGQGAWTKSAAAIGPCWDDAECGAITITGGMGDLYGGAGSPGIGASRHGKCGNITIGEGIGYLRVYKGEGAPEYLGKSASGTSGTVSIPKSIKKKVYEDKSLLELYPRDPEALKKEAEAEAKAGKKNNSDGTNNGGDGGVPGAAEPGAPLRWYHRQNAYNNLGWDLPPEQYTFMGEPDTIKVMYHKGKAGGVEDEYLIHSQNRLDGWFKVTKEQAGAWKFRQNYDDYMSLDIDGKRLIANKDWRTIEKADWTATEGWHKFMIVYGDANVGLWGRVALDLDAAIMVAMNGGAEMPFEDAVEFHVAKAQEVPGVRVPAAGDKGLVAYWPFDGSAHDVSGNGHHGTVRGASLTADRNGRANSAYHFEASDYACIRVPNSPALEKIERSVTIAAWVKPEKLDRDWVPIAIKGAYRYQFGLNVEKQKKFIMCSDRDIAERNVYVNAATTLKLGEWQHVAVTCDGAKMKVFINGKCMGVRVANTKFPTNNDEFFIGRDHKAGSTNYTGDIDEFCIYSRALSDEEVSALYESEPDGGKDGVGSGGAGSGAGGDGDRDSGSTETPPAEPPTQPGEPKSGDGGSTEPPTGGEPPDHADPAGGGDGGSDGGKDGPKTGGGGGAEPDGGGKKPEEDPEGYLPPEEGERPKDEVVIKGPPWESGDSLPPPTEQESPPDNMALCGYFKKVGTKVIYFLDGKEAREIKTKKGTIYCEYPKQISATHNSLYFTEDMLVQRTAEGPRFSKAWVQFRWSEPDDRIDLYVKDDGSDCPRYQTFPKCSLNFSAEAHWAIYVANDGISGMHAFFTGINTGARLAFGRMPKDFEFDKKLKTAMDISDILDMRGDFMPTTGFCVRNDTNGQYFAAWDYSIKGEEQRIAAARTKAIEELLAAESQEFGRTGKRSDDYVCGPKYRDYFSTNDYYIAAVRVDTLDGLISYACFLYEYRNDTTPKGGYWNRVSNNVERVEKSELGDGRTAYAEAFETKHKVIEEYFKTKTDSGASPPKTEKVKAARFAFESNCSRPPATGLPGQKFSMRVKYTGVKNDILAEVEENPVNYETYMSFRQYGPASIFHFDGDCYDESKLGASNRERGLVAGVSTWPAKGLWADPESKTRLNLRDNMVWAEFPEGPEGEDSDRWLEVSYWDRPDSGYGVFNIAKTTWYYEWVPGEEPPELPKEEEPPFEEEDEDDGEAAIKFAQNGMGLPANKDKFVRKSEDKKKNKVGLDEYRIPFLVMNMPTNREYTVKATLRRIGATGENGTYLEADAITNEIPYSVVAEKDKKYGDKGIWEAVIKETGTYELPAGTTEGIQLKIEAESGKKTDKDYVKVSGTFPIYRIHLGLSLMLQANTIPCHWKMREESKYKLDKQDIAGDPEKDPEGKYVIEQEDFDVPMREGSFMLLLYDEDLEDFIRIPAIPTNTCVTATKVANDRYCKARDAEADHQTMVEALGIEVMSTGNKRQNGAHIVMVAPTKAVLDSPVRLVADLTVDTIFGGKTYTAKKRVLLHSQPLRAIETMEDEKKYLEHDEHIRKQLLRIMFKIESTCPDRLFAVRNMIERMLDGYDYRFGYDPHQIETIMEMYVGFQEGTFEGANGTPYKVSIGDDLKACYAFMQGLRDNTTVLGRMAMGIMTGGVSEHVFTTMTVLENMQKEIMTCKDVNKFGLLEATKIGAEEIGKQILIELALQGAMAGAGAVAEKGLGLDVQQTLKNIGARYRKVMDGADSWLKNNSKAYALGDKALQGCKNYLGSGTKAAANTIERTILSEEEAAKRAEQLLKKSRKNLTPDELADVAKYEKAMENGMNKVRNLQAAQQAMEKARGTNKFKAAQEKYFESCNEVWTDKCALKKLNQIKHEYAYKMRQEFNNYREGLLDKVQQEALGDIANKLKVSREELYIHNISKNKLANNTTPKGGKGSTAKGGKNSSSKGGKTSSSKGGKKNTAKGNEKTYTDGSKTPNDRDVTMMKKNAADRTKDLTIDQTLGEEALARRLWKRMHKNQEPPSMKEALEFMKGKDVSYVNPNGDASSYVFEHNLEGYEDLAGTLGIGKDGKYCESLLAKDLHNPAINAACIKYKGTEWWGPRVKAKYAEAAKLEALAQKYKGSAKQKLLDQAMDLRYRAVGDMCEGIRQIVKQTEGIIIPRGNYRCGGNPLPTHLQELHALAKRVGTDVSPTEFVKVLKSHNLDLNSWADTVSKYVNAKSLPAPKTNFPNILPPKAINDALDREIEKKNGRR